MPISPVGTDDDDDVEPFPEGEMYCAGRPALSASNNNVEGLAEADAPVDTGSGLLVYGPALRVGGDLPENTG